MDNHELLDPGWVDPMATGQKTCTRDNERGGWFRWRAVFPAPWLTDGW